MSKRTCLNTREELGESQRVICETEVVCKVGRFTGMTFIEVQEALKCNGIQSPRGIRRTDAPRTLAQQFRNIEAQRRLRTRAQQTLDGHEKMEEIGPPREIDDIQCWMNSEDKNLRWWEEIDRLILD